MVVWMKGRDLSWQEGLGVIMLWAVMTAAMLLLDARPAHAQNQAASIELAKHAALDEALFDTMPTCEDAYVRRITAMVRPKNMKEARKIANDATKSCQGSRTVAATTKVKVVNNVADSIQKNRFPPALPYGYSGAYASGFLPGGGTGVVVVATDGGGGGYNCGSAYGRRCNP